MVVKRLLIIFPPGAFIPLFTLANMPTCAELAFVRAHRVAFLFIEFPSCLPGIFLGSMSHFAGA